MLKHIVYPKVQVDSVESSKIIPLSGSIASTITQAIDEIDYSTFFAVRYFVAIKDFDGHVTSFDYTIATDGAGGVRQAKFGNINGGFDIVTESVVESGLVKFKITNNTLNTIFWKLHKLGF